jgi:5'-nucleotidase
VPAFGSHLFLSADTGDVKRALDDGYAAATIFPSVYKNETDELRIAFDGDAVIFSDEAERVYQSGGLDAFARRTAARARRSGAIWQFLAALHDQSDYPEDQSRSAPHLSLRAVRRPTSA